MTKKTKKKRAMSRRRFLKKAGLGAGAAAGVAPVGTSALVGKAEAALPEPTIRLAPEFEPSRSAPLPEHTWPLTAAMCLRSAARPRDSRPLSTVPATTPSRMR